MSIRTRFAPSPTGYLHVGGIRTALFAYLTARNHNGQFILRIEDTDQKRLVEGSMQHLQDSLNAIGITYDEGVGVGGNYGPYLQSERLAIYQEWAQKLIDLGLAYADPYTAEELQSFREQAQAQKQPFLYRKHRPEHPPTWDGTTPLRFKCEPNDKQWHDEVMGDMTAKAENMDDFIIIKSDGYPTYNFAHIIDDHLMQISHVIRGQEFISSMPNFLNLYDALSIKRPVFAHMPHILAEQGNKKLSKRDGAKDVLDYIRSGYLPEALMNFIATLGWNDGTEQELFTEQELIETFSLCRVQHSGARFDEKRLLWMNGQWIRRLTIDELAKRVESRWPNQAQNADQAHKMQILSLVQDRLKTLNDIPLMTSYFFTEPTIDWGLIAKNKQLKKLEKSEIAKLLNTAKDHLAKSEWNASAIQDTLNSLLESTGQKPGILFSIIRIATTWAPFSPQLNDTLELLGKDVSLNRIQKTIDYLQ